MHTGRHTWLRNLLCAALALVLLTGHALAMERAELRETWRTLTEARSQTSPWAALPDTQNFSAGELTDAAQADALGMVNFARSLAGLPEAEPDELYTLRAQLGALVLSANDVLTHAPEQPAGMPEELYRSGFMGTSKGNIASFNWFSPDILVSAVTGFLRDDGEFNLETLSHRRWLLDPNLRRTGFGLARAASGNSYAVMYVVDDSSVGTDSDWDFVAWPSPGTFPVELMQPELAWSVSLNPVRYDTAASSPVVTLTEEVSGESFRFDISAGTGDGYCSLSTQRCGSGDCLIFRPDMAGRTVSGYQQNQRWNVEVRGLRAPDSGERSISYRVDMVSVYPQYVANVEMSPQRATLAPGESLQLSAEVIPAWADELSIHWQSSAEGIASVDERGLVTAYTPGECEITATSVNGRSDVCMLSVE